jgi:hypothetical protein
LEPHHVALPVDRAPTIDEAVTAYRQGWARIDAIVAASALDARCARSPR